MITRLGVQLTVGSLVLPDRYYLNGGLSANR